MSNKTIVVVGGGHAGIEAAMAASNFEVNVILVTHSIEEIGKMPCNPAIGGLGKGQLVKEIDVLGGWMARVIDTTGIQFRTLNSSKGPAVQSPRAQADKENYQKQMESLLVSNEKIKIIESDATRLLAERQQISGVELADGSTIKADAVILCSGTFLSGLMHTGPNKLAGGREGAPASNELSESLEELGFELYRLKTGTPPRIDVNSVDYSKVTAQPGDHPPRPFSFTTDNLSADQIDCYITRSNQQTRHIISTNLDKSPLFAGIINGLGPRYCPSIEDKVVRFPEKTGHNVFLEPEGINSNEMYVNGLSTSLPAPVQDEFIKSVAGLENAVITRYGYAVEYDSIPSWQVKNTLETNLVEGLYCAGQILGTSGYEEAAAQGLMAGINAAKKQLNQPALVLKREESYIGVLIDDLVTKEITEPYRMFTSRVEYRLSVRCDNAESRLVNIATALKLHSQGDIKRLKARAELPKKIVTIIKEMAPCPKTKVPIIELLKRPEQTIDSLEITDAIVGNIDSSLLPSRLILDSVKQAENDIKYEGYIARQNKEIGKQQYLDYLELPADLDYMSILALSFEAREKLHKVKPSNISQASRVDGVRQSDLAILTVIAQKTRRQ